MRRDTATCTPVSTKPSSVHRVLRSLEERDSMSDSSIGLLSLSQRRAAQYSRREATERFPIAMTTRESSSSM